MEHAYTIELSQEDADAISAGAQAMHFLHRMNPNAPEHARVQVAGAIKRLLDIVDHVADLAKFYGHEDSVADEG